ncbi:hypothetical protein T484DRAFT_3067962 [Baffinella frigidus]|nr:hypothetical protein T484DRAFT_3067962 [Cryptophyta sp. CCMP2293]
MMAANRRALSAAGALCLCAAAAALVALALVGRSSGQRSAAAALLESSSPRLAGLSRTNEDMEQIIAAADAAWAAGAGANPSLAGSDHVVVAPADMKDLFDSDLFEYLSTRCCKSLYFAPGAEQSLPTDWDVNGEEAQRVRAFVGLGNTLVFNDGKGDAIAFINKVEPRTLATGGSRSAVWQGGVCVGVGRMHVGCRREPRCMVGWAREQLSVLKAYLSASCSALNLLLATKPYSPTLNPKPYNLLPSPEP